MGHNGKTLKECAEELSKAAAQARANICELMQIEAVIAVLNGTFEQLTEKFDEAFELLRKLQTSIEDNAEDAVPQTPEKDILPLQDEALPQTNLIQTALVLEANPLKSAPLTQREKGDYRGLRVKSTVSVIFNYCNCR